MLAFKGPTVARFGSSWGRSMSLSSKNVMPELRLFSSIETFVGGYGVRLDSS